MKNPPQSQENLEIKGTQQSPETEIQETTKLDAKKLKNTVKEKSLTQEQQSTKEELEKDLASGMKVSEAIGKWSTRLDTMDSWLTLLPFVGDAYTSTAGLLFFIAQNQRLSEKYRLPWTDKFAAMVLQIGDRTVETLIKTPLNSILSIPVIWWIARPILAPINATVGFVADSIFKANKWTAKLFKKSFEQMLADAETWNKEHPSQEQIDVVGMKAEMDENMKEITNALSYKNKVKKTTTKENEKRS